MARSWRAAITTSLALALASCVGDDAETPREFRGGELVLSSDLVGDVVVEGPPIERGGNELTVRIPADRTAALVRATPFMPSHGHGSAPASVRREGERFVASGLKLYMAGTWEIELEIALGDARRDSVVFVVDVP